MKTLLEKFAMVEVIEKGINGELYGNIYGWVDALKFMQEELKLPVARVGAILTKKRLFSREDPTPGPMFYFENKEGDELGCWTQGVERLQVFSTPRKVGEGMRAERTMWQPYVYI
jgi:hypothetical protein